MVKVNLEIIAQRSGLSLMTVSRVLRGVKGHSQETEQKVRQIAQEMGYRPNGLARALRSNRTGLIGLLINRGTPNPAPMDMFAAQLIAAAEVELMQHEYMVLLGSVSPQEVAEGRLPAMVSERYVEGLVAYGIRDVKYLREIQQCGVQVVTLDTHQKGVPAVMSAHRAGGYAAGKYLWQMGHRRFAFVDTDGTDPNFQARLAGMRAGVREQAGHAVEVRAFTSDQMSDCGFNAGRQMASMTDAPTAVLGANDFVATYVMKGLYEGGKRVPEDVSVMGFDDLELASHLTPPLTTLAVPREQMGRRAVQLLMELMGGRAHATGVIELPVQFVERGSVRDISSRSKKGKTSQVNTSGQRRSLTKDHVSRLSV